MKLCFFHILDRDQPDAAISIIHHQQLFDPELMEQSAGLIHIHGFVHRDEVFLRHQFANRLIGVFGKSHIAVGQNADKFATIAFNHRDAGNLVPFHQRQRIGQRALGVNGHRVYDHPGFEFFDRANLGGLQGNIHILVEHADTADLRHGNRHIGFCYRVHRRRNKRDAE